MSIPCYIAGLGSSTPSQVLTNKDLEARVKTDDAWIQDRTGIKSRHALRDGEQISDIATEAARQALATSGLAPDALTHIICGTCTPEYLCPTMGCLVSQKLGIEHPIMAFDVNAACSGFVYALDVARGLVTTNPGARILTIGSEALTRRLNWNDRSTCILFGDGAAATVVSADPLPGDGPRAKVIDTWCLSDARQWGLLTVGGGTACTYTENETAVDDGFFVKMSGREVFKFAVRNMTKLCKDLLARNNMTLDDVDFMVPHQANLRIIEAVRDRLGIDPAKVFINIDHMGNTSAASIPLALTEAWQAGALRPGMRVLVVAFGGGLTWAASLLHF